jgi:hypothetical protein
LHFEAKRKNISIWHQDGEGVESSTMVDPLTLPLLGNLAAAGASVVIAGGQFSLFKFDPKLGLVHSTCERYHCVRASSRITRGNHIPSAEGEE